MSDTQDHIVRSFDQDLARLRAMLADMGGIVENQIAMAMEAILRHDTTHVGAVIAADERVDALERDLEQFSIRLLALRQPMADDLRRVIAALKTSAELERIGDYAKNIAKRATVLAQFGPTVNFSGLATMSELVQKNLRAIITAIGASDVAAAILVWRADQMIDDVYNSFFREMLTYMMEDPRAITPCTHLLFLAKNLERIGDRATNIAEILHYAVTGEAIREARPKGESSALSGLIEQKD